MANKYALIALFCFTISLFATGHVIRNDNVDDLFSSEVSDDLKHVQFDDNITYYSYHIHVYFLLQNKNQTNEAATLRERFISKFNVDDCNDDCETWCPRICHWDLNMAPVGYDISF